MTTRHQKKVLYWPSIEFIRGESGIEVNTVDPETGTISNYGYLTFEEALAALTSWIDGKKWRRPPDYQETPNPEAPPMTPKERAMSEPAEPVLGGETRDRLKTVSEPLNLDELALLANDLRVHPIWARAGDLVGEACGEVSRLRERAENAEAREGWLHDLIGWALGESPLGFPDFPSRPDNAGLYWWRIELRRLAGFDNPHAIKQGSLVPRSEAPDQEPTMRVYGVDVPILPPTTASAIPRRSCYSCETGFVEETNIRGRTFDYRGERLTLDVDVRVPVCDKCGEIYFRGEATQVFSSAMERLRLREPT